MKFHICTSQYENLVIDYGFKPSFSVPGSQGHCLYYALLTFFCVHFLNFLKKITEKVYKIDLITTNIHLELSYFSGYKTSCNQTEKMYKKFVQSERQTFPKGGWTSKKKVLLIYQLPILPKCVSSQLHETKVIMLYSKSESFSSFLKHVTYFFSPFLKGK